MVAQLSCEATYTSCDENKQDEVGVPSKSGVMAAVPSIRQSLLLRLEVALRGLERLGNDASGSEVEIELRSGSSSPSP